MSAISLLLFATYLPERSPNVHKTRHKHINFGLNETFASRQPIRAGFEAINRSRLAIEHSVMFGRDSRKNSSGLFSLSLLLLNGNIETNPGPQHKYPCGVCSKAVKCNQKRIQCDTCEVWYRTHCCAMNDQIYDSLTNYSCIWVCKSCGLPNFSSSLLDSFSGAESFNSFEPLGDVITNSTTIVDSTTNSSYPSPRSSTPSCRNQNNPRLGVKLNKLNSLRVLTVNCCSLRSVDKRQSFDELVIEHNPDVICGTESHLSDEYFTAEVFPSTFNVIRKKRPVAGGGECLLPYIASTLHLTSPHLTAIAKFYG